MASYPENYTDFTFMNDCEDDCGSSLSCEMGPIVNFVWKIRKIFKYC